MSDINPLALFSECESCGYWTLTFLGVCTNIQCRQPKEN
jgi:hypothetical protein